MFAGLAWHSDQKKQMNKGQEGPRMQAMLRIGHSSIFVSIMLVDPVFGKKRYQLCNHKSSKQPGQKHKLCT